MMRRGLACLALVSLLPARAAAQDVAAMCERARHPAVGSWSQFQWHGGRNDGATLRMSVVGRERRDGADYIWLEIVMRRFPMGPAGPAGARDTTPRIVSKVLVPGIGQGSPRASVIKVGDMPAMELPTEAGRATPGAPGLDACASARVVGWESVTVPAGTFRALHVAGASGNAEEWFAPDVPFALVKESGTEDGEARQLLLVGHGTGARSLITETPQPFDPRRFALMMMGARGGGAPPD
jgi:hypothetical protein